MTTHVRTMRAAVLSMFLFSFLTISNLFSQNATPSVIWQKAVGSSLADALNDIQPTADGGFIAVGYSVSPASGDKTENNFSAAVDTSDIWIVKLDANGNIQWDNTITASNHDYAKSVKQLADGSYIIGANSYSNISGDKTENGFGGQDYWLIKLDANGAIVWQKTMGGSGTDNLNEVQATNDGGFIVGGYSDSSISGNKTMGSLGSHDYWVIKFDANANIEWQNVLGTNGIDILNDMKQTADGGYILGGFTYEYNAVTPNFTRYGAHDFYVVKIDAMGQFQWHKTYGGSSDDYIESLQQTADGGYIFGGYSTSLISGNKTENSNGGANGDYWIIKTDALGNIQWQNSIGGISLDYLLSVKQTPDGGYILGGYSYSGISADKMEAGKGGADFWIVKTNDVGSVQWQKTIGGNSNDVLQTINVLADGSYILGGYSTSNISGDKTEASKGAADFWIVKLSDPGAVNTPSVADVYYCPNQTAQTLTAVGQNLLWYTTSTGGVGNPTAPTPTTTTQGITTYYVSQTINNIESPRVAISVIIKTPPSVTISGLGTMCTGTSQTITAYAGTSFVWSDGVTTPQRTIAPTTTTTYTVTLTGVNGCSNSGSRTFYVDAPPVASITGPTSICNGTSTTLTANSGSTGTYYSYRWSTGQTTQSITVNPTATRSYSVTITMGTCTSVATRTITVNGVAPNTMSIVGLNSSYLKTAAAVTLVGSPTGGTFRVNNVIRTTFNPSQLTVGNHTVTYTITQSGCTSVISKTVAVTNPTTTNLAVNNQSAFNGRIELNRVKLEWANNTGSLNDYFIVQKLNENGDFIDFKTINAVKTNSEINAFSAYDEQPTEGDNTYRIKTVFIDRTSTFSSSKTLNYSKLGNVQVFPNPAVDNIDINLEKYIGKPVELTVYNQFGQAVLNQKLDVVLTQTQNIELSNLQNGQYILRVVSPEKRDAVVKFIINK